LPWLSIAPLLRPGGAAGVEDGRQVVGRLAARMAVRCWRGALEQRAGAVVVEREHMAHAGAEGEAADQLKRCAGRPPRRLGVAMKYSISAAW
jgi:hypothetical protein